MMSGSKINGDDAAVGMPVEMEMEETSPPATQQQKLVKAGLLCALAAIVVYVILDYTVSAPSSVPTACC